MKYFKRDVFFMTVCLLALSAGGGAASAQSINRAAKMWTKTLVEKAKPGPIIPSAVRADPVGMAKRIAAKQKLVFASEDLLEEALDRSFQELQLNKTQYGRFAEANERRIIASKELLRRQIAWYNRDRAAILSKLEVHPAALRVDYTKLINPSTKVIYLGEIHYLSSIRREVFSAVMQYRRAYPDRKVYLLTEFMETDYPGESHKGFYRNVYLRGKYVVPEQMPLLHRMASAGVLVRGLEPVRGFEELSEAFGVEDRRFVKGSMSLIGQSIRNHAWTQTINDYRRQDPDAVFFIYTGWGHCSYKYLESLPFLVREPRSQVITFNLWWKDTLTPAFDDLFKPDFLRDSRSKAVAVLKDPTYRRLLGADVLVHLHE